MFSGDVVVFLRGCKQQKHAKTMQNPETFGFPGPEALAAKGLQYEAFDFILGGYVQRLGRFCYVFCEVGDSAILGCWSRKVPRFLIYAGFIVKHIRQCVWECSCCGPFVMSSKF